MMDYKDSEIEKTLENLEYNFRKKVPNYSKIRLLLNQLWYKAFKEGVYVGK